MSKNVTLNGVDYSGISQVMLNLTGGGTALFKDVDEITAAEGLSNISTGTANPESGYQLYIPVEEGKTPFLILTWSDTAFEAENVVCGHVVLTDIYMLNGIKDVAGLILYRNPTNGLQIYSNSAFNKADGSGYVEGKGYLMDRASGDISMRTTDTFNYIVFYKPVGDLSFGGE